MRAFSAGVAVDAGNAVWTEKGGDVGDEFSGEAGEAGGSGGLHG